MEISFWHERWEREEIGFHRDQINPRLSEFFSKLPELSLKQSTILVPLCGKSLDLLWLSKRFASVIGVECSEIAIEAFFKEAKLRYQIKDQGHCQIYSANNITLIKADFFALEKAELGKFQYVYDRAALVALPTEMRQSYVRKVASLQTSGTIGLLITLGYKQELMSGPPFSVDENEVTRLFSRDFDIELLSSIELIGSEPRFAQRGLDSLIERSYRLYRL